MAVRLDFGLFSRGRGTEKAGPIASQTLEPPRNAFTQDRLGQILLRSGLVTQEQLQEALAFHRTNGVRLGEALVRLGYCKEEEIVSALARQHDMPFVSLEEPPSPALLQRLAPEVARSLGVVPAGRDAFGRLLVAARNPLDPRLEAMLATSLRDPAIIAWGVPRQVDEILTRYDRLNYWAV